MKKILWIANYYDGEDENYFLFAEIDNYEIARQTFNQLFKNEYDVEVGEADFRDLLRIQHTFDLQKEYKIILK